MTALLPYVLESLAEFFLEDVTSVSVHTKFVDIGRASVVDA